MKSIGELFDLRHKKSLRLGVLLLSTLLIGSASALVYYSIQVRTTTTTASAGVKFVAGADCNAAYGTSPCGVTIPAAATYASLSIKTYPNATVTYEKALNVSNTDGSTHQIRLNSVTISGGETSYDDATSKIVFKLIANNGTTQATVTYTVSGGVWSTAGSPSSYAVIAASAQWRIQIEATADSTAATGVNTTIDIKVDVQ